MNEYINLLVTLRSAGRVGHSPEAEVYALVRPLAPILNLKLIGGEDSIKAFVQVQGLKDAERVIAGVQGRAKVVLSKHTSIAYPRSLNEIVANKSRTRTTHSDISSENQGGSNKGSGTTINFFKGKMAEGDDSSSVNTNPEANTIRITHGDVESLKGGRVLRIFRRFGRIVSLNFDYESAFWMIKYRSDKEVSKITNAIANNTLYGYKLHVLPIATRLLRLDFNGSNITTIEQASIVCARMHVPVKVYECVERESAMTYFIAEYARENDAAEALQVLSNAEGGKLNVEPLVLV